MAFRIFTLTPDSNISEDVFDSHFIEYKMESQNNNNKPKSKAQLKDE